MNDLTSLPTAWTSFVRRLMQAADEVFKVSGADAVKQPAYFPVSSKGDPLLWVITQGVRVREAETKREKKWAEVYRHVCDQAGDVLASNKDGCAIVALSVTLSRDKKLLDWSLESIYRVEPSNAAVTILKGLTGSS